MLRPTLMTLKTSMTSRKNHQRSTRTPPHTGKHFKHLIITGQKIRIDLTLDQTVIIGSLTEITERGGQLNISNIETSNTTAVTTIDNTTLKDSINHTLITMSTSMTTDQGINIIKIIKGICQDNLRLHQVTKTDITTHRER